MHNEIYWAVTQANMCKYLQAFKKAELTGKYLSMSDSTHLRNLEYVSI